jgi:uncharacterized protein (TIGR00725 family)
VAVVGSSEPTAQEVTWAESVGRLIAEHGAIMVCGGLGGVMDAAARGCTGAGGVSIGILPGERRRDASRSLTVAVTTGIGEARNALVVRSADVVVAVGGEFGTLSEIAFALKMGKTVVGLDTWDLAHEGLSGDPLLRASSPEEAVAKALAAVPI